MGSGKVRHFGDRPQQVECLNLEPSRKITLFCSQCDECLLLLSEVVTAMTSAPILLADYIAI
jgi:hypothetical protein